MTVLVLNSGSSSLKYFLYDWDKQRPLAKGIVERVSMEGSFIRHTVTGKSDIKISRNCETHREAINLILDVLTGGDDPVLNSIDEIDAVGHRVVHGGEKFNKSVLIDEEALNTFKELSNLAPLHNPPN
ncbi:MAG: propionate kinase, partial [Spirochaetes bacterium]